ncbi:hypothetical protein BDZ45DRAFT_604509 [Acephala macrosclerotiorum]|nr:hypothetical protein BDZ45DRAFT_604509 [Acephala macrosclerotiorum]
MIRFVSALSLAEFNQSALPELDQSTSKQEPKKSRRIPDALEEFFVSLDAQATSTAGPSTYQTATYGKTPIAKNLISKPVVAEEGVLIDLSPTQECAICVEEKRLTDFPLVTEACQHPPQTCLICVQNWLTRELDNTDWDKIHCVACKEVVLYDNMKRILTPATFEKYDQYSRNSLLSTLPEFRWCISPTCKSGQIHENGVDGPIFFCTACFSKACVIHNVVWHEGETCNEYDYRKDPSKKLEEEKASRIEIKESSKPCPGPNCKVNITRNGGCDHMKCTRCKYEFCWLCLADYDKIRKNGNSSHKKSCKLHTDNLPD